MNTNTEHHPISEPFAEVRKKELGAIREHRKHRDPGNTTEIEKSLTGLALSGGGIRSASFALGVLQGLTKSGILKKIDYLSTVSGGGYIGSSLTWFLHKSWDQDDKHVRFGPEPSNFPFGERGKGARTGERNVILDFIRQHGKYLDPGHGLNSISLIAVVLRSIIISLAVYFPITAALMFLSVRTGAFKALPLPGLTAFGQVNCFLLAGAALAFLFFALSILYSWFTFFAGVKFIKTYEFRILFQKWIGILLAVLLAVAVVGSLPLVDSILRNVSPSAAASSAASSTVLGIAGGFFRHVMVQQKRKWKEGLLSEFLVWVASILLIYGLLMLSYLTGNWAASAGGHRTTLLIATALAVLSGIAVNLNYVSLHRMYRDRLMETFLPDLSAVSSNKWGPAKEANKRLLSDMCSATTAGPYHLINTNLILVDSRDSKYRGRGGDSFILSPLYCGSDATLWGKTEFFIKGKMTLSTAMAISGAAINPHTGVAGQGMSRNGLVSFLMTFLNIGLGYWVNNPRQLDARWVDPNYFRPGIKGLFGLGFDEHGAFIELSDGGHFDNTGLYELIRRKVKLIILSDAGADPECCFADLANAVEKVRVDFGVHIKFPDANADLVQVIPEKKGTALHEKHHLSKKGFAIGTIEYPDAQEPGVLYYLKPALTPGLPEDLYAYKCANPSYPHQSTTDQFFDETQFEAYRELGYRLTESMVAFDKMRIQKTLQISISE